MTGHYSEDMEENDYPRSPRKPYPGMVCVAKTHDVEVADELIYFANREEIPMEYWSMDYAKYEDALCVWVFPADVEKVHAFMSEGPFIVDDFVEAQP